MQVPSLEQLHRLLGYLECDSGNLRLRLDTANEACNTGQWKAARMIVDDGLRLVPEQPELLALSGLVCLQALQFVDAEHACSRALAQGLNAPAVRYNLAYAIFMQQRYQDAALQLSDPDMAAELPMMLLLRARCQHFLGQHDEAIADCLQFLATEPEHADAHGVLALLLEEQQRYEEAKPHMVAALRTNSGQLEAMLALASMQRETQDFAAARTSFESLLQAHPECGRGWFGLASVAFNDLQLDVAKTYIERALVYMPEHLGSWHMLAWLNLIRKDLGAARQAFESALAVDRTFDETYGGLAVMAALGKRSDEAQTMIRRALRLNPRCMSAQYARFLLLMDAGDRAAAQALFDEFLSRPAAPDSPVLISDLVATHMRYLAERHAEPSVPAVLH